VGADSVLKWSSPKTQAVIFSFSESSLLVGLAYGYSVICPPIRLSRTKWKRTVCYRYRYRSNCEFLFGNRNRVESRPPPGALPDGTAQIWITYKITYLLLTYSLILPTDNCTSPNRDEAPRRAGFGSAVSNLNFRG
jgi:hypothetical protein